MAKFILEEDNGENISAILNREEVGLLTDIFQFYMAEKGGTKAAKISALYQKLLQDKFDRSYENTPSWDMGTRKDKSR